MMARNLFAKGFSLVELVVGIAVMAIVMMIMNTMLVSQSKDALEPLYRLRASQLGQSIMQDILTRAYDENADHNGGRYRCDEIWGSTSLWYDATNSQWTSEGEPQVVPCTDESSYGIDSGETVGEHQSFNDVDDFITDGFESAVGYGDVLGEDLLSQYANYAVSIDVQSVTLSEITAKKVIVIISTPSDENIRFSVIKGNY